MKGSSKGILVILHFKSVMLLTYTTNCFCKSNTTGWKEHEGSI